MKEKILELIRDQETKELEILESINKAWKDGRHSNAVVLWEHMQICRTKILAFREVLNLNVL